MAPFESTDHGFISSSDDIEEGTTNQFFTQTRARESFSITNTTSSTYSGVTYIFGGLNLTNGTITYIPPTPVNLSPYAPLASPALTGTPTINGTAIPKHLDQVQVNAASGNGNLVLQNGTDVSNLLVYTPPAYTNGSNMTLSGTEFDIPQSVATTASPSFVALNATTISPSSGNILKLHTNPTTQVIEVKSFQFYPITNNSTIFGGSLNRWSTGYFVDLNASQDIVCTRDIYTNNSVEFPNSSQSSRKGNIYGDLLGYVGNQPQTHFGFRLGGDFGFSVYYDVQNTIYCWTDYAMYAASYNPSSDDRIKSNEKPITKGVSVIEQLQPKIYDKHQNHRVPADKEDNDLTGVFHIKESGFIAQEVDKIPELKHLVAYNTSHDLYTLNYDGIIPYLVQSIKELNARIKTLESK